METWQIRHITSNLPKLLEYTECNDILVSILRSKSLISANDEAELMTSCQNKYQRSNKLYQILEARVDSYEVFKEALFETKQSGAYQILNSGVPYEDASSLKVVGTISYNKKNLLGHGCNNTEVFEGTFSNRKVAIKKINRESVHLELALHEINQLIKLDSHENIVHYFTKEISGNFILIALELCQTNLSDWCENKNIDIESVDVLRQATQGIKFLHNIKIAHRDLKPENILIRQLPDKQVRVKISDFGISWKVSNTSATTAFRLSGFGTFGWVAPEVVSHHMDGSRALSDDQYLTADIFSLGCIFYFVLSNGSHPFGDAVRRQVNIVDNKPCIKKEHIEKCYHSCHSLIRAMISNDFHQRPTSNEIPYHVFFWLPKETLQFFLDATKLLSKQSHHFRAELCEYLRAQNVIERKTWSESVEPETLKLVPGFLTASNTRCPLALQYFMAEIHENLSFSIHSRPPDLIGQTPSQFLSYWQSRFPKLLPTLWLFFERMKHHPIMQQYYPTRFSYNVPKHALAFPKNHSVTCDHCKEPKILKEEGKSAAAKITKLSPWMDNANEGIVATQVSALQKASQASAKQHTRMISAPIKRSPSSVKSVITFFESLPDVGWGSSHKLLNSSSVDAMNATIQSYRHEITRISKPISHAMEKIEFDEYLHLVCNSNYLPRWIKVHFDAAKRLVDAVEHKMLADVKQLCKYYASLDTRLTVAHICGRFFEKYICSDSILHAAVRRGNFPIFEYIFHETQKYYPQSYIWPSMLNDLLLLCIENTHENSEQVAHEKVEMVKLLVGQHAREVDSRLFHKIHFHILCCLFDMSVNLSRLDQSGKNVMVKAAKYMTKGQFHQFVKKLCDLDIDLLTMEHHINTLLEAAFEHIDVSMETITMAVKVLGNKSMFANIVALIKKAIMGRRSIEFIKMLMEQIPNKAPLDDEGTTVLHLASTAGYVELIKYIISNKNIDINMKTKKGMTPFLCLFSKFSNQWLECAKTLIRLGANVNSSCEEGNTALHYLMIASAVQETTGWLEAVLYLLEKVSNPSSANNDNKIFLNYLPFSFSAQDFHLICKKYFSCGHHKVHLLFRSSFNKNLNTILHLALKRTDVLEKTLDLFKKAKFTFTEHSASLLFDSIRCGRSLITLKNLSKYGVSCNATDFLGNTALHVAFERGNIEVARWLKTGCGLDINAVNKLGKTSMHSLFQEGYKVIDPDSLQKIIEEMSQWDVNWTICDKLGKNAIQAAVDIKYYEHSNHRLIGTLVSMYCQKTD